MDREEVQDSGEKMLLKEFLSPILERIGKLDQLESTLSKLEKEWYASIDDLQSALSSDQSWLDLKLPGRLKLELKKELENRVTNTNHNSITIQEKNMNQEQEFEDKENVIDTSKTTNLITSWLRCWSVDDCAFYYYNCSTEDTQWEEPTGTNIKIDDDPSCDTAYYDYHKCNDKYDNNNTYGRDYSYTTDNYDTDYNDTYQYQAPYDDNDDTNHNLDINYSEMAYDDTQFYSPSPDKNRNKFSQHNQQYEEYQYSTDFNQELPKQQQLHNPSHDEHVFTNSSFCDPEEGRIEKHERLGLLPASAPSLDLMISDDPMADGYSNPPPVTPGSTLPAVAVAVSIPSINNNNNITTMAATAVEIIDADPYDESLDTDVIQNNTIAGHSSNNSSRDNRDSRYARLPKFKTTRQRLLWRRQLIKNSMNDSTSTNNTTNVGGDRVNHNDNIEVEVDSAGWQRIPVDIMNGGGNHNNHGYDDTSNALSQLALGDNDDEDKDDDYNEEDYDEDSLTDDRSQQQMQLQQEFHTPLAHSADAHTCSSNNKTNLNVEVVSPSSVSLLREMGFGESAAIAALIQTEGDISQAAQLLADTSKNTETHRKHLLDASCDSSNNGINNIMQYANTGIHSTGSISNNIGRGNNKSVYREVYGDILNHNSDYYKSSVNGNTTMYYDPTPPTTPAPVSNENVSQRHYNNHNNANANANANATYNHVITGLDAYMRDNDIDRSNTINTNTSVVTSPAPPNRDAPRSSKWRINVFGNSAGRRKLNR